MAEPAASSGRGKRDVRQRPVSHLCQNVPAPVTLAPPGSRRAVSNDDEAEAMALPSSFVHPNKNGPYKMQTANLVLDPTMVGANLQQGYSTLAVTIYYPEGVTAAVPPVLVLSGRFNLGNTYLGYAYLAELLVTNGFVVVSPNLPTIGAPSYMPTTDWPARAQAMLTWLVMLNANSPNLDPASQGLKLGGLIDVSNVGVVGHSTGGSVMLGLSPAGAGYTICGMVGLAPYALTPDQMTPVPVPQGVPFQIVHGSADCEWQGAYGGWYPYESLLWSPSSVMRSWVHIENGNHNYFNSVVADASANPPGFYPDECYPCFKAHPVPTIAASERITSQQDVAAMYVHCFLQTTLRGDGRYETYLASGSNPVLGTSGVDSSFASVRLDYRAQGSQVIMVDNFESPEPWQNNQGGNKVVTTAGMYQIGSLECSPSMTFQPDMSSLLMGRVTWQQKTDSFSEYFLNPIDVSNCVVFSFRAGQIEGSTVNPPGAKLDFSVSLFDNTGRQTNPVQVGKCSMSGGVGTPWLSVTYPGYDPTEPPPNFPAIVSRHSFLEVFRISMILFRTNNVNLAAIAGVSFQFDQGAPGDIGLDEIHFSYI